MVLQLVACDAMLDVEPEIKTTYTNYFKGEKDAAALLYDINASLFNSLYSEDQRHEIIGLKADRINAWDYDNIRNLVPDVYKNECSWSRYYGLIYSANVILDNAYRFTDIDEERLEYYKRQACFVKGFSYFQVARQWGDAPIVPNSTIVAAFPREKVTKVLEEAIRNAEIALELPRFEDLVDEHGAKITAKQYGCRGAATALLAHIYAWRAGLLGDNKDWEKAERYCTEIIDGKVGNYKLAEDPAEVCKSVMKGNSAEGIFEGEYYLQGDRVFMYKPCVATTVFLTYPVKADDLPTTTTRFEIYKTTVKEIYKEGDRRRDAYFFKIDSVYMNPSGEEIPVKKAFLYKWNYSVYRYDKYSQKEVYKTQDVNRIVWRLADIMLLRAECRARLGAGNAADDLNEIRKRAYGNYDHNYTAAEGDLRYVIFKEREKELLFEGHRFYDVMRNGYWKTELTGVYSRMSEAEFNLGAQYYPVHGNAFEKNDLMRQNEYWQSKGIK